MEELAYTISGWPLSKAINESSWIFAVVQAFHLVALAFLAGSVLMVDLRLLGKGFSSQPTASVARDARPWLLGSIVAMVLTGIPQFISLAPKEFEVLAHLVARRGEAVSRQELMDAIWGDAYVAISRSLDVHMTSLRAKLGRPEAIATIRGYGYRWSS